MKDLEFLLIGLKLVEQSSGVVSDISMQLFYFSIFSR